MNKLWSSVLLFGIGVVVGTAGSDDTMFRESARRESTAYERGYTAAASQYQAVAVQTGHATWKVDPDTGRKHFLWEAPHFSAVHELKAADSDVLAWTSEAEGDSDPHRLRIGDDM